jgi:hypothetical protein
MYAEMMRRMQQKDNETKKKAEKVAIYEAADMESKNLLDDPEEQERIRKRQAGKPVTIESFNAWKVKFDAEMNVTSSLVTVFNQQTIKESSSTPLAEDRPTGKQLFLMNKAEVGVDVEALIAAAEQEEIVEPPQSTRTTRSKTSTGATVATSKNNALNEEAEFNDEDDDEDSDYADEEDDDDDEEDFEEES